MQESSQYFNDTQEIDMEFLSREFDEANKVFPVNLVIHSSQSAKDGYDASKTGMFKRINLMFDPTKDFHEYRFDYLPGHVIFYADGQRIDEMEGDNVPSSGGHIILQHWSNGNPKWSGGPPSSDAVVFVASVKAYFNSSNAQKRVDWHKRCDGNGGVWTACAISDKVPANVSKTDDAVLADGRVESPDTGEENGCPGTHQPVWLTRALVSMMVVQAMRMTEVVVGLGLNARWA
jgi:beta-glucanase (GH16 family)